MLPHLTLVAGRLNDNCLEDACLFGTSEGDPEPRPFLLTNLREVTVKVSRVHWLSAIGYRLLNPPHHTVSHAADIPVSVRGRARVGAAGIPTGRSRRPGRGRRGAGFGKGTRRYRKPVRINIIPKFFLFFLHYLCS